MGLAITVTLPFGRYAATPWGQHVNEGDVEWPPSAWRLTRALTSSWHVHHPELDQAEVTDALQLLCGPPSYDLPATGRAITRHYMPSDGHKSGSSKHTDLVLNAFVATYPGACLVARWPVTPTPRQLQILAQLSGTISYLGRAESRASIQVASSEDASNGAVIPITEDGLSTEETIRLLVPEAPLDMAAVQTTTATLQKGGRIQPDGTRWVTYPDRRDAPTTKPHRPERRPTVMQFAIVGGGRPEIMNAALLAAEFRRAFTRLSQDHPELHGHGEDGEKRTDDHQHARYAVLNRPDSGRADSLVLLVPEGLPITSVAKLAEVTQIRVARHLAKRLGERVDIALELVGSATHLPASLTGPSRMWGTLTPFTTLRHRKPNQSRSTFIERAVRAHLRYVDLPFLEEDAAVEVFDSASWAGPGNIPAVRWYRARRLGRDQQHDGAYVRITFADPVSPPDGMLTLGSLAHFGLGVFGALDR